MLLGAVRFEPLLLAPIPLASILLAFVTLTRDDRRQHATRGDACCRSPARVIHRLTHVIKCKLAVNSPTRPMRRRRKRRFERNRHGATGPESHSVTRPTLNTFSYFKDIRTYFWKRYFWSSAFRVNSNRLVERHTCLERPEISARRPWPSVMRFGTTRRELLAEVATASLVGSDRASARRMLFESADSLRSSMRIQRKSALPDLNGVRHSCSLRCAGCD